MSAEMHLLTVFPSEVWKHLLECVDEPKDRAVVLRAFPELSGHFGDCLKAKCLFGEVLPLISRQLRIKDILNCRTTCKLWHRDIHTLIANHPYHTPYNEDPENGFPLNTVKIDRSCPLFQLATSTPLLHFRNSAQIIQFLEMAQNPNGFAGRKIFGGNVFLDPLPAGGNSREVYEQSSLELLRLLAPEIRHLTVGSDRELETSIQFYKRLRLSLQLTPNLRSLYVDMTRQIDPRSLSLIIDRLPLPPLSKLECFYHKLVATSDGTNYPRNITDALISKYVTSVDSQVRKVGYREPTEIISETMSSSKITEFEIDPSGFRTRLMNPRNPSEKDCIQKVSVLTEEEIDLIQNLKGINKRNVKVVDFSYPQAITTFLNPKEALLFPSLHTLYIRDSIWLCYHFLTGLPGLKRLEIWKSSHVSGMKVENIPKRQLSSSGDEQCYITQEMLKLIYDQANAAKACSNVWCLFPKLKQVVICTKDGNRVRIYHRNKVECQGFKNLEIS